MSLDGIVRGAEFGPTEWLEVDQQRIDRFAAATGDAQSIHVDPELAVAGPFGTTVAHGFLTLSLIVPLWNEVAPDGAAFTVNYGLNRLRFPAPVPAGARIRAHFRVLEAAEVEGGLQATLETTVERESSERPACVAEWIIRLLR